MKKIILYEGDMETTSFFLRQLQRSFEKLGCETYNFVYDRAKRQQGQLQGIGGMLDFFQPDQTIFLSFNFQGIYGDDILLVDEKGQEVLTDIGNTKLFVDFYQIPYWNIVVDHPYHYHKFLCKRPRLYWQVSIDRNHIRYMKRYFPEVQLLPFLPSGGTKLPKQEKTLGRREKKYDVVFTGTYMEPECFEVFIWRNGPEYAQFYHEILSELLAYPERLLEDVARAHLIQQIPEATEAELKETLGNLQFLDYYIRFFVRGQVVRALVDGGVQVHVFGGGWERFSCACPENLIFEAESGKLISLQEVWQQKTEEKSRYLDSAECLERIAQSKISLNVMPWFRDGAHDRIFNSMLNEAVVLTDDSVYLREIFQEGRQLVFYDLTHLETLPGLTKKILSEDAFRERLVSEAKREALQKHTWASRGAQLVAWMTEM